MIIKYVKKICLSYFGANVSQSIVVSSNFLDERFFWNFGKVVGVLSVKPSRICF